MAELTDATKHRTADHPIEDIFVKRWSPRAMSGAAISDDDLMRLFEAARWAPSTYNEQEWRFLYAKRDSEVFSTFFELLADANQAWCNNAAALVVVCSHKVFSRNGKPNPVHTLDAGAAWENLALQGAAMGLVIHGMAGFNNSKAAVDLKIPDDYDVEMMIAIGHPGEVDSLPDDYQKMEEPSGRKPVDEICCEGQFSFND